VFIDLLEDVDCSAIPRMPAVLDDVRFSNVGFIWASCATHIVAIRPWGISRQSSLNRNSPRTSSPEAQSFCRIRVRYSSGQPGVTAHSRERWLDLVWEELSAPHHLSGVYPNMRSTCLGWRRQVAFSGPQQPGGADHETVLRDRSTFKQ